MTTGEAVLTALVMGSVIVLCHAFTWYVARKG